MRTISARAIYNDLNYSNWVQNHRQGSAPPWATGRSPPKGSLPQTSRNKAAIKKRITLAKVSITTGDDVGG